MAVDPRANAPEENFQYREFQGVNQTDARTALDDKEFYWLEQAMPIGKGAMRTIPPPAASVATIAAGVASLWGFSMNVSGGETNLLFSVNTDGSMSQINPTTGSVTTIASANTVSTSARLAMWKDNPLLVADPTKGTFNYNGTTFATTSSTILANDIQVFEGRAWHALAGGSARSIQFSSPNTFNDFTAANGAGTTTVTDSAFPGTITRLLSALEQLWIIGPGAVNTISNVQTTGTPLVTTFSNTNVVANVGTIFAASVSAFFRLFLFLTQYGVYAIVGSTPQKLSDKLDGLFPLFNFTGAINTNSSATGTLYDVYIWCVLVTYQDPTLGNRPLLLCFAQGKWFFVSPNMATTGLTYITSLIRTGVPEVWATDGSTIFQLFPSTIGTPTGTSSGKIQSSLHDYGDSTQAKEWVHFGMEFQSSNTISATLTIENENAAKNLTYSLSNLNVVTWVGAGPVTWVGSGPVTWIGSGLQLFRKAINMTGRYLGWTLTWTLQNVFTFSCYNMGIRRGGKWQ